MRGKKAKELRKIAEEMSVGRPYREYEPQIAKTHNARGFTMAETGAIQNTKESTRGALRYLKKHYKQGALVVPKVAQ